MHTVFQVTLKTFPFYFTFHNVTQAVDVTFNVDLLSVHVGETFPLEEMGFRSGNQFLYQLEDYIDVRKVEDGSGRLFVFVSKNCYQ